MSTIFSTEIGNRNAPLVVFGHGWGRSHNDFIPIAEACAPFAHAVLLDLPGFGASPRPEQAWNTSDYAQAISAHIAQKFPNQPYIWVGHSFGGRIGLRLASECTHKPAQLFIIAGAGIPKSRTITQRLRGWWRKQRFAFAKRRASSQAELLALEQAYGSIDYVQSRQLGLRDIFLAAINEDQSENARTIDCPTKLFYGAKDQETPSEIGQKLACLIPKAQLLICPEFDHLSLLERGRHQVALALKESLAA